MAGKSRIGLPLGKLGGARDPRGHHRGLLQHPPPSASQRADDPRDRRQRVLEVRARSCRYFCAVV